MSSMSRKTPMNGFGFELATTGIEYENINQEDRAAKMNCFY